MQILIIYASYHHKNTEKIAHTIAKTLDAKTLKFYEANIDDIDKTDFVGFGSGVYNAKFHKGLEKLVDNITDMNGKPAFIFSTAGVRQNILINRSHKHFRRLLQQKHFTILGEFDCLGFDTNGLLKHIGGLNKNRPNKKDLENAKSFAKKLLKNYSDLYKK